MAHSERVVERMRSNGWITIAEASDILGIAKSTVYDWCRDGRLKTKKVVGHRFVDEKSVKTIEHKMFAEVYKELAE